MAQLPYSSSLRLMDFPSTPYFLTPLLQAYCGPILTFLHHIIPISLLLLSLDYSRPIYFPQGPFIYFMGLWSIIPAIRAQWFFYQSTNSFLPISLGFFLLLGFQNEHQQHHNLYLSQNSHTPSYTTHTFYVTLQCQVCSKLKEILEFM